MSDRVQRLRALLAADGLDALVVSGPVNVRYLTGFTGSSGLAVVGRDVCTFLTDFRYVEQSRAQVAPAFARETGFRVLLDGVPASLGEPPLRLGFDDAELTVREHQRLREQLPGGVELIPASGLVERLRAVKEPAELGHIRAAAAAADVAFAAVLAEGIAGRTEREIAWALEQRMREAGADGPAFAPIVAAGPHGARPHAEPRSEPIARGQLVVIDWGAIVAGYQSDCTRTIAVGEPGPGARERYELVRRANTAGTEAVRAGAPARAVDRAARAVIAEAGYGEQFGHGLGHGVGLETHEAPRLGTQSDDVLEAGNVLTIEPGVYLPGELGVRIEDLVLVTAAGGELLTGVDRDLIVLD